MRNDHKQHAQVNRDLDIVLCRKNCNRSGSLRALCTTALGEDAVARSQHAVQNQLSRGQVAFHHVCVGIITDVSSMKPATRMANFDLQCPVQSGGFGALSL